MRFVLFISEDFVLSFAIGRNSFANGVRFENNEAGKSKFSEYLLERRSAVFIGVLDSSDETFESETLPHLTVKNTRNAVQKIVRSKYGKDAMWRYNKKRIINDQGKSLQIRLTTVAEGSACAPWLNILKINRVLVTELCVLSEICTEILKMTTCNPSVLVLRMSAGDYRLIGFREQLPVITRKLSLQTSVRNTELVSEIEKTRQYLARITGVDEDDGVLFIGNGDLKGLDCQISDWATVMEPGDLHVRGRERNSSRSCIELIVEIMLVRDTRSQNRLSGDYRTAFDSRRIDSVRLAGIFCGMAFIVINGIAGARVVGSLNSLTAETYVRSDSIGQRMAMHQSEFTDNDGQVDAMRTSIEIGKRLNAMMTISPMLLLDSLAVALSSFPDGHITSVNWKVHDARFSIEGQKAVEYEASINGFISQARKDMAELAQDFRLFVAALDSSESIHFVEVTQSPFGSTHSSTRLVPGAAGTALEFTINLKANESFGE